METQKFTISAQDLVFLIIDIQEKLIPMMDPKDVHRMIQWVDLMVVLT